MAQARPPQQLCYMDMGGTFTDVFGVDAAGDWALVKVPSTPKDISQAFFNGLEAIAQNLGLTTRQFLTELSVVGYGSTVVINTVLNRNGSKTGLIVNKGFEHIVIMDRGKQTWVGMSFADRTHLVTHRHTVPIVPLSLTRGVTERIDCLGCVQIPLYEHEVRQAARELLEQGVETIAICLLFSWQNHVHEHLAREMVESVAKEMRKKVEVFCSVDVKPVLREFPRMNTTVIEAYTSKATRAAWGKMDGYLKSNGFKGSLQIIQSGGGLATATQVKAVETIESGPVGGLVGGQYIGQIYGFENLITTDVGGTSFDVGLVTSGMITVNREPVVAGLLLATPVAEVNSIGAGGGTIARIDPLTGRLSVGPDSAGADPGPVCYDIGGENPTVTDADLMLGYLDPDYFLGGKIKLNKDKAYHALKEKIADPLGLSPQQAALGIKKILDTRMRDAILGMVMARGYEISQYHLLGFGGAGATHVAGYSEGLNLKGVLVFPYSAVFCAFGASAADYEHHYTWATNVVVPPGVDAAAKVALGRQINDLWASMEKKAIQQMQAEGFSQDQVRFLRQAMVRYGRQLDDLIVPSPVARIETAQDWDKMINAFENMYEQVYAGAAKFPQAGYEIFELGLIARVPKMKPKIKKYPLKSARPPAGTLKSKRVCWFDEGPVETKVYDWEKLQAGNKVSGPALLESSSTTIVVPPNKSASVDEYLTVWLK